MNPLLQAAVTVLVLWNLASAIQRGRGRAWGAVRHIRLTDVVGTFLVAPLVILSGVVLSSLPVLDWGWWKAIGGKGSVVFASTGSDEAFMLAMIAVIAVAVPELALREEEIFRRGSEHRSLRGNVLQATLFGVVHALMGIPLGFAVALSVAGGYFTYRYLSAYRRACVAAPLRRDLGQHGAPARDAERTALTRSTAAHITWNWTLLAVAAVAAL